jgi:hypothetical protein
MLLKTILLALLLSLMVGCEQVIIEHGHLTVCADSDMDMDMDGAGYGIDLSGTVVAIDAGTTECSRSLRVEDADGNTFTVGLTVLDAEDLDITPNIDLQLGDNVVLIYRDRLVWGSVSGFVIYQDQSLVIAAEEGTWGGALKDVDLGFTVSLSEEPSAVMRTECVTTEGYALLFEGDETVSVEPVSTAPFQVDGQPLNAIAVRADVLGPGRNCAATDLSNSRTWVVAR